VAARIGGAFGILANQIFSEIRRKTPPSLSAYEALLTYYNYSMSINSESFHRTLGIVKAAIEQEPEYGSLLAALAALYVDNFVAGFCPEATSPLEDAETYARRGVELDPNNQSTHAALAYIFLIRDIPDGYAKETELAQRLNPNNAYYVTVYGYYELLAGRWEHGFSLMQEANRLNPYHPNYFNIAYFLYHYAHHNYQQAYQETMKLNTLDFFFVPLCQAAALGQLGRQEDAKPMLEKLLRLRPDFPDRAHELIGRLIKAEGQVEHILEGLQKAGLGLKNSDK
jgi:tetratricopeptide (TPR) repeat protein